MTKKKILFFVKEAGGGTGTFLDHLSMLDNDNIEKYFFFYKKSKYYRFRKAHELIGNSYPATNKPTFNKSFIFLKNIIKSYLVVRRTNPDIIFVVDFYSFLIHSLLKFIGLNWSTKLIYFLNVDIFKIIDEKPNILYRQLLKVALEILHKNVNLFIFPSKGLALYFERKFKLNKNIYKIIPHDIDIKDSRRLSKKKITKKTKNIFTSNDIKIISVGRLTNQKDFTTLIRAFSLIIKKSSYVRLIIIGDGKLKKELMRFTKNLGIKNKVFFLGRVSNIFPYLRLSDIFVFSSLFEGFGITILEAMSLKLPIIATNSPYGPAEILNNGKYGKLVSVGDFVNMAKQLTKFSMNKEIRIRYGLLGYKRAKFYSVKKMLNNYSYLFNNL